MLDHVQHLCERLVASYGLAHLSVARTLRNPHESAPCVWRVRRHWVPISQIDHGSRHTSKGARPRSMFTPGELPWFTQVYPCGPATLSWACCPRSAPQRTSKHALNVLKVPLTAAVQLIHCPALSPSTTPNLPKPQPSAASLVSTLSFTDRVRQPLPCAGPPVYVPV